MDPSGTPDIDAFLDASIELELNVGDLYALYSRTFPEDTDFWWNLSLEEKNHAALLRSGREYFLPLQRFPAHILHHDLDELRQTNQHIRRLIEEHTAAPPSRETAFHTAVQLEESAGEAHFQQFMATEQPHGTAKLFQTLNQDDRDHAERIRARLAQLS